MLLLLFGVFVHAHGLSLVVSKGYSLVAVCGLFIVVASLVEEYGPWSSALGFQSMGSVVVAYKQLLHGMWNLPGPGIEPASPALAGRFLPTVPPGEFYKFKI